jgi:hypothetical protein
MTKKRIPTEALIDLQQRLGQLPSRCSERRQIIQEVAHLYGVSEHTIYRALRERNQLHSTKRTDSGQPRVIHRRELERYCEVIAALKIRTSNRKGRHLSTNQAIRLLEEHGIDTPEGHLQAPEGLLKRATINRYLKQWGYDHHTLLRQPPAVRFEATESNQCWHFDLSPSDLKHLQQLPEWASGKGRPQLMLYSVVDDRTQNFPLRLSSSQTRTHPFSHQITFKLSYRSHNRSN